MRRSSEVKKIITVAAIILCLFMLHFSSSPAIARNDKTKSAISGKKAKAEKLDGKIISYKLLENKKNLKIYHIIYYSDGLKVKGLLYLPPVKAKKQKGKTPAIKLPLVIFCHDGIYGISEDHEKSSIRIAKKGYAVFCPAYRGEVTSYRDRKLKKEKRDRSEGEIEIAKGEVNDVFNSINMLSNIKCLDMDRVALIGASHGALISFLVAARTNKVRALVFAYGVADIYKWYKYLKKSNRLGKDDITKRTYGKGPKDKPENFKVRNAVTRAGKINCPVLILQGSKDKIVPENQAFLLRKALRAKKKKSTIRVYPDAMHGFLVYAPYDKKADKKEKKQTAKAWKEVFKFLKESLKKDI